MRALTFLHRPAVLTSVLVLTLAGCTGVSGDFDWDMRSTSAGNTREAVAQATQNRPTADARGVISYPNYQVVITRPGETVTAVARRLNMDAAEIGRTNAIHPDLILSGGQLLVLPRRVSEPVGAGNFATGPSNTTARADVGAIATTALDRVAPAANTSRVIGSESGRATATSQALPFQVETPSTTGTEPLRHKVAKGESAYVIARRYNVSAKALAEWNGLNANMDMREGQTLLIPPADATRPPVAAQTAVTTVPGQGSPTPQPPSASRPLPVQENPTRAGADAKPSNAPASPSLPTTTASASGQLGMPADGSIVRAYAKGKYDGIGIGAAAGSPVRAAAAGTVAAITRDTDQVPIVVIRHEGNLLTVYANVEGVTVAKGASVSRGQQIGKVRAGNPTFLHFEVRRGAESVDPMSMLR